jgi:hypothetical protein
MEHFYHVYATRAAYRIVAEHLDALSKSGLADALGKIQVGIAGPPKVRGRILDRFYRTIPTEVVAEADEGWEQVTLQVLWGRRESLKGAVLYAHTKGAADPTSWNAKWRRSMTKHVVGGWRRAIGALETADAVGCHWIDEELRLRYTRNPTNVHFFAGNFWWARADYIGKLAPPSLDNRWEAEKWIGTANPRMFDLLPGFPTKVIK